MEGLGGVKLVVDCIDVAFDSNQMIRSKLFALLLLVFVQLNRPSQDLIHAKDVCCIVNSYVILWIPLVYGGITVSHHQHLVPLVTCVPY